MIQEFTVFLLEGWTVGRKGGNSKTGYKNIVVRDKNNFGKGGSSEEARGGQNQALLEVELAELLGGLKIGCEWKRGIKDDFWVCGLSN